MTGLDAVEVTPVQRRDLKSAVQTLCRLIGQPLSAVPANVAWVHVRLRRIHPAQVGLSAKRLKNIRSGVLKALELCGASRSRSDWLSQPSQTWTDLLAQVPDQHDVWKLTQFAQYCSTLGVAPEGVENDHIKGLLAVLTEDIFLDNPTVKVSTIVSVWSHAIGDSLQTTMKSYAQFEQQNAVRHYQASVTIARTILPALRASHG